jgi:flagellar biosynthesis/type III secretory pathway protein FliH
MFGGFMNNEEDIIDLDEDEEAEEFLEELEEAFDDGFDAGHDEGFSDGLDTELSHLYEAAETLGKDYIKALDRLVELVDEKYSREQQEDE